MKTQESLATKIYDLVKPALTPEGILDDELQRRVLAPLLERIKRRDVDHSKYFDFSVTRKINNEIRTEGWKP